MKRAETQEEIIKRLSNPNYQGGNYALPENASELEKSKYDICQNIARYQRQNEILAKDLAYDLGISLTKLEEILYCRINSLKLDALASCLEKLEIPFHLEIDKKFNERNLNA